MYRTNPDFVFTVADFVRSCQTPVLILPDDIGASVRGRHGGHVLARRPK
jgi:hypothetical protein